MVWLSDYILHPTILQIHVIKMLVKNGGNGILLSLVCFE